MGRYLFMCIFLFFFSITYGQYRHPIVVMYDSEEYTAVDTATYRFIYRLLSVKDPSKPANKVEDVQALDVGKNISKYYSWLVYDYVKKRKAVGGGVPNNPHTGSYSYEVFKNHPAIGIMTVTDIGYNVSFMAYVYDEPMPKFEWKIEEQMQEILGHRCQKATTSFRGRNYTAWFTMEIPISDGPWKFGGLPGLIMKVTDSENHYEFECIGIERISEPVRYYKTKFQKTTREELNKYFIRFHKDELNTLYMLSMQRANQFPNKNIHSDEELPYNPLERDFK